MTSVLRIALRTLLETDLPELEGEIRIRQVVDLNAQTPFHAIGNVGNGVMLTSILWDRLPHAPMVGWLGILMVMCGFQMFRWWRKRSWPVPRKVSRRAMRRSTGMALFAGAMWAAAVIFTFPREDTPLQLLMLFLAGGLGAGAIASMSMQPIGCIAYVAPPLISVLVLLALNMSSPVTRALTGMGVLYFIILLAALFNGFSSFVTIVRNRVESSSLETRLLQLELATSTEANRAKSMFLASMSHELRTPLNAIIGFSEVIRDQALGATAPDRYRDYAGDIHEAGQHLLQIVNDILDISRIEAGRLSLDEDEVDLERVVATVLRMVGPAAARRGVDLSSQLPGGLPALRADELRVRQILVNLLSNAVTFAKPPGKAVVGAGLTPDGGLAVWVRDDGIGMSNEDIVTALKPFHQVESSLARGHGGAGLGLSLVDGFIRLHGGHLEIESAPAAGTTVRAVFPAARVLPGREWLRP